MNIPVSSVCKLTQKAAEVNPPAQRFVTPVMTLMAQLGCPCTQHGICRRLCHMRSNMPFFQPPPSSLNLSPDSAWKSQLKGLGWDCGHQTEITERSCWRWVQHVPVLAACPSQWSRNNPCRRTIHATAYHFTSCISLVLTTFMYNLNLKYMEPEKKVSICRITLKCIYSGNVPEKLGCVINLAKCQCFCLRCVHNDKLRGIQKEQQQNAQGNGETDL